MTDGQIDPARLSGEALRRWHLRSPEEIERERAALAARRYADFFGSSASGDPGPGFRIHKPERDPDPAFTMSGLQRNPEPGFGVELATSAPEIHPGLSWIPAGPGRWRRVATPDPARETGDLHKASPEPTVRTSSASTDIRSTRVPSNSSYRTPVTSVAFNGSGSRPPVRPIAEGARPVRGVAQPRAPLARPASQSRAASQPQGRHPHVSGNNAGRPDPSRTEVFQRGPDGKLHPIPGWHTTGPFDFDIWARNIDWGGVGSDLTSIALGALTFMQGGTIAGRIIDGLGYKIGPDIVRGIIHGHHSWPKFMGGPNKQELARLYESIHTMLHDDLAAAFKQAGFPRIGGRGGGTKDWANYFKANAGKREEAIAILQRVTREFDRKNGTKISKYLDDTLAKGNAPVPKPLE